MKFCPACQTKYEDGVSFCALDGEVLEDDPSTLVNTVLDGQYQIESLLGKGGMGAVYRARHILLGDRVAIKVLPPQMRNNAEWLRRFRREGQAARRFRHPNAVTVYDLRTTQDGLIYMVMEYVEGHTLDAELKARGRFSPAEALSVIDPIASVLNAAHAMGVVHRDLKPENIMIGKAQTDGVPVIKLLDLGIAKMREIADANAGGSTALTVAGQVLGTPYYMSPEQWGEVPRDGNTEIDGRADIYSLGTVIYELVAGRRPFSGLTIQELRREHVSVTPRPLHEVIPEVPEAFGLSVARAMSKDRGDRQATAGEFADELRAAVGQPAIQRLTPPAVFSTADLAAVETPPQTNAGTIAQTSDTREKRETNSDLSAPTILTLDGAAESTSSSEQAQVSSSQVRKDTQPTVNAHVESSAPMPTIASSPAIAPQAAQQSQTPAQTIATNPQVMSAQTNPHAIPQAQPPVVTMPARRSSAFPIVLAVLALLIVAGAGGGWFLWKRMSQTATTEKTDTIGKDAGKTTTAANTETVRYWLEIAGSGPQGKSARVAGAMPLASGQSFKFHFMPDENGYLYIVGPGEKNVRTTFLTARPDARSGVTTNEVKAGADFSFPNGAATWLTLDKTPGTENYMVIFSPTPLTSLDFLAAPAGRALNQAETSQLEGFRHTQSANEPETTVVGEGTAEPYVAIKLPKSAAGRPAVFSIRIEHK